MIRKRSGLYFMVIFILQSDDPNATIAIILDSLRAMVSLFC